VAGNLKKESSEEVCDLLLGFSRSELQEVKESYLNQKKFGNKVSEVISTAFVKAVSRDDTIASSLSPVIRDGVTAEIQENPEEFAEILAPIMGPAIRASILNALNDRMESIDAILQQSFTPAGLKWRVESLISGRKFSDIVLSHTLLYKIEDIFLIYKKDSTLLASASNNLTRAGSSDLISAMLSGISDFATDSFGVDENSKFSTFRVGELSVIVFDGTDAMLAVSHKGSINSEARIDFENFLDVLHVEYKEELENYKGDTSSFLSINPLLKRMLGEKLKKEEAKNSKFSPIEIIGLCLLVPLVLFCAFTWHQKSTLKELVKDLKNSPGITITKASSSWGDIKIEGIRDPLSVDPKEVFEEHYFFGKHPFPFIAPKLTTDFASYASLDPGLLEKRIKNQIYFPQGTTYRLLKNGEIKIKGQIKESDRKLLYSSLKSFPGVNKVRFVDSPPLEITTEPNNNEEKLQRAIKQLEDTQIFYKPLVVTVDRVRLHQILNLIKEISQLNQITKNETQIRISYKQSSARNGENRTSFEKSRLVFLEDELLKFGIDKNLFSFNEVSNINCKNCDKTMSYIHFSVNQRVTN